MTKEFYPNPPSSSPYVCAGCKSCFKRYRRSPYPDCLKCPRCGGVALSVSKNFKVPKRDDGEQWAKVAALLDAGSRFDDVGEPYPDRLSDTPDFIRRHQSEWMRRRAIAAAAG